MAEKNEEYRVKICLLGEFSVGKTSLIRRYVKDVFDDMYLITLGVKVTLRDVKLDEQGVTYTLAIWDVGGHVEPSTVLRKNYLDGSSGALVVCDVTRKETLEKSRDWANALFEKAGEVPIVLLANKSDLEATFSESEFNGVAGELNAPCFHTSARTGQNVEKAFLTLTQKIFETSV